ncbi:hypothetical protein [Staphylococcus carnosus]|uniref:hypothetical protein n=1 Tax=Staphylococcus carnosus TaxID=1281 RepID=UPI000CD0627A|nr:hypothetical protein [Staphylococcus carnosus]PNZ98296.1 hypothetical protein CD153_11000 [Staphylococcus carnosus]QRQ06178.1 hypothetical protein I6J34_05975 [Staphylococcus carnosus]UTB81828.1 hypothetical protein A2I67_00225 [Staphylococcus carnosus]SUM08836.1 putative DNA-binding protein [Staphylococcus carnosus]GEP80415.1 hypothetical protein SCA05_22080 [Staphylococcus carnosus]
MLTKEFAQRVDLSEKQVRKIVQHLEERGYHLNKTEYRGREATDFQEEDIELFKEIADKVKKTNSYELAFEELEKENDFLQIVVKEDNEKLPSDQNFAKILNDLHNDISKMREERQMLGQMISQVHQQQKDLQTLQQQMTDKLDQHAETLKAIETAQQEHAKAVADNTKAVESNKVLAQPQESKKEEQKAPSATVEKTEPAKTVNSDDKQNSTADFKGAAVSAQPEKKEENKSATAQSEAKPEASATASSNKEESSSTENKTSSDKPEQKEQKSVPAAEMQETPETTTPEPEIPVDAPRNEHQPTAQHKQEKKGFFARLFGM